MVIVFTKICKKYNLCVWNTTLSIYYMVTISTDIFINSKVLYTSAVILHVISL